MKGGERERGGVLVGEISGGVIPAGISSPVIRAILAACFSSRFLIVIIIDKVSRIKKRDELLVETIDERMAQRARERGPQKRPSKSLRASEMA